MYRAQALRLRSTDESSVSATKTADSNNTIAKTNQPKRLGAYYPTTSPSSSHCPGKCWGRKEVPPPPPPRAPVTRQSAAAAAAPVATVPACVTLPKPEENDGGNVTASLRDILSYTHNQPDGQVFIVRRIQRLGYDSPDILYNFFKEDLGMQIRRVMVVASTAPDAPSDRAPSVKPNRERKRPANMGFVIAENSYEVQAIIAINNLGGGTIDVEGVPIVVAPFVKEHSGLIESSPVSSCVSSSRDDSSTAVSSNGYYNDGVGLSGIDFDFDKYVRDTLDSI